MKVLFLEIDTESSWAVASIGPAFLAALLRKHGHEVAFFRVRLEATDDEILARVRADAPELLALSLTTRQWQRGRAVVRAIRSEIDVPVVAGGLHPTFSGDEVLRNPGFDYVCLGEGELPLLDLVSVLSLRRGRVLPGSIKNIWVKGGPRPELRRPFEPIDALPFMARDFLDERYGVIYMATQRGCPFPCTYCAARMYDELYEGTGENYGRRRSHENVLEEIFEIQRNGQLNYIIFFDDTFTIHHPWVYRFCGIFEKRAKIPFSLHARVETVDQRLLAALAKAGCRHITYGVESGSPRVRKDIMRRPVSNQRFKDVFRWTKDAGILVTANYMVGLPGETKADVEQTLALHDEILPDDFGYFVFYPYPGTSLFKLCLEKGYLPEDYLDLPANHRETILRLPDLTPEDVGRYYDQFTARRERDYLARYGAGLDEQQKAVVAESARSIAAHG